MSTSTAINARPSARPHRRRPGLMAAVLRPGSRLMGSLRLTGKLSLVAASLLLPMLYLMANTMQRATDELGAIAQERAGVGLGQQIVALVLTTQSHRGLTNRVLQGDDAAKPQLLAVRTALRDAVQAMDRRVASESRVVMTDVWKPLQARLLALGADSTASDATAAFAEHSAAIESLRQMMLLVGERSGLVLDPAARSFYLMDIDFKLMVPALEATGITRGLGAGMLARHSVSGPTQAEALGQVGVLTRLGVDIDGELHAYERAGGQIPPALAAATHATATFSRQARDVLTHEQPGLQAQAFFDLGSATLGALSDLNDAVTTKLNVELNERDAAVRAGMWTRGGAFLGGLLLMGYLTTSFYVSFRRSLRMLGKSTRAVAEGDLSCRTLLDGRDELSELGATVDAMTERLSLLVAEIRSTSARVNMAGEQLAEGSTRLSQRTDDQASSLRQTVHTITELSEAVSQNAVSAGGLDALTARLSDRAIASNGAMNDTVHAMRELESSSQAMAAVVRTIDDVAFQTSMLSLNAAVEAARAGESGKGFAIVAGEVRQLAQRCAESADEIRGLIETAVAQVERSSGKLQTVSGALTEIVSGVGEVSNQLRSISAASAQQSTGLAEVTASIGNLDEITRQNAAMVEESHSASSSLVARANAMRSAVASMRLRHGTADEARALVERAVEHLQTVGREQALRDFHDPDGEFIDRDLYLFIIDRSGVFNASGLHPEWVSRRADDCMGRYGAPLVQSAMEAFDAGGGWIHYETGGLLNSDRQEKDSYVLPIGEHEVIGCGVHPEQPDGVSATAAPRAVAWSLRRGAGVGTAQV